MTRKVRDTDRFRLVWGSIVVQPGVKCLVKSAESNYVACELELGNQRLRMFRANDPVLNHFGSKPRVGYLNNVEDYHRFIVQVFKLLKWRTLFVLTFELIC
jgi:hypothetical protein